MWSLYSYRYHGIFTDIVAGLTASLYKCSRCGVTQGVFDSFVVFTVPLPWITASASRGRREMERERVLDNGVSLQECFRLFSRKVEMKVQCNACGTLCEQMFLKTVAHWPKVLFLQLNRFVVDSTSRRGFSKNPVLVDFPLSFEYEQWAKEFSSAERMPDFHKDTGVRDTESGGRFSTTYHLVAVVYHHGTTLENGHYTCTGHLSNNTWVSHSDSARPIECSKPDINSDAYILVYSRE